MTQHTQPLPPAEREAALTEAMRLHFTAVRHFIGRTIEDYDRAEDLTQELFFSLYRRGIFKRSYIYSAAANTATSEIRRRNGKRQLPYHFRQPFEQEDGKGKVRRIDPRDPAQLPDAQLVASDRDKAVSRAVAELPESCRAAFVLFTSGRTYDEVAAELGRSTGTVKSQIFRGRKLLRDKVSNYL